MPLHIALEKNSKEIGKIIILKGADINTEAIIYLNIIILFLIKIILNKLKKLNKKKKTPLHYAARNNSKEIGELLISKGAYINAKNIIYLNIIIVFLINGI